MTSTIAIIPARGGSKRLPRKNIAPFLGRPMIAHTIEHARAVAGLDRVLVSTEDDEIASVARGAGAEVAMRQTVLATDSATVTDVCLDILDSEAADGRTYDILVCLYATAPLRIAADIDAVLALVTSGAADFAMAVTPLIPAPNQALWLKDDGELSPMWPELVDVRGSDLDPMVIDNGSTCAMRVGALRKHRSFYGPRMKGHVMPRERSIDIDEPLDLELALWHAARATGG